MPKAMAVNEVGGAGGPAFCNLRAWGSRPTETVI